MNRFWITVRRLWMRRSHLSREDLRVQLCKLRIICACTDRKIVVGRIDIRHAQTRVQQVHMQVHVHRFQCVGSLFLWSDRDLNQQRAIQDYTLPTSLAFFHKSRLIHFNLSIDSCRNRDASNANKMFMLAKFTRLSIEGKTCRQMVSLSRSS